MFRKFVAHRAVEKRSEQREGRHGGEPRGDHEAADAGHGAAAQDGRRDAAHAGADGAEDQDREAVSQAPQGGRHERRVNKIDR